MTLADLAGKRVYIEWIDDAKNKDNWHYYLVKDIDRGWIRVMGIDDPEGAKYQGGFIWIRLDIIDVIEEL